MAQRRYAPQQVQAVIAMGDRPPNEANWWTTWASDYIPDAIEPAIREHERAIRNVKAGAVGSLPQSLYFPQFAAQGGAAVADWIGNKVTGQPTDFWGDWQQRAEGGPEGQAKLRAYVDAQVNDMVKDLTPEEQADPNIRAKAENLVMGSQGYHDERMKQQWQLTQLAESGNDAVRRYYDLQPTYQMTPTDELGDAVGNALIPTGWAGKLKIAKAIGEVGGPLVRGAGHVAEWFMPGSTGPGNAVVNVVAQTGAQEGMRYLTGGANVFSKTGRLPEDLYAETNQPQGGPATSSSTPKDARLPAVRRYGTPMMEDATAPAPFG